MQKAVSRGCGTLFFGVFAIMGLVVTGIFVWSFSQSMRPYFWKETPCVILESHRRGAELETSKKSSDPLVIHYRYNFDGTDYTSDRQTIGMKKSLDTRDVERLLAKYSADTRAVCYVNSSKPDQSVIFRASVWPFFFILMPLIFVAVGVGGIIATWVPRSARSRLWSRGVRPKFSPDFGLIFFFGLFALVGGILTYFIGVRPVSKHFASLHWPEVPCEILSSSVGSHRGNKGGTTYSIDITYRYTVAGRSYESDTYGLMFGSSNGYDGKAAVVRRYSTGSRSVCYVNPDDPTDALLNRDLSAWLLIALIPILFLLVGVIGIGGRVRSILRKRSSRAQTIFPGSSIPLPPSVAPQNVGPVELQSSASPFTKFAGALFVAAFWNTITGVFVGFAVKSWLEHKPEWFLTIFISPFVLIGLVLLVVVGSTFLALFNPRLRMMVSSQRVPLGGSFDVNWAFGGSASRIQRFKLTLEGREEVTYRRGTNTHTDKSVFASLVLVDASDSRQVAQGNARAEIPSNLMHSWAAAHNKVVWTLKAVGEIPRYPDVQEEFEFAVVARSLR